MPSDLSGSGSGSGEEPLPEQQHSHDDIKTTMLGRFDPLEVPIVLDMLHDAGIFAMTKLPSTEPAHVGGYVFLHSGSGDVLVEAACLPQAQRLVSERLPQILEEMRGSVDHEFARIQELFTAARAVTFDCWGTLIYERDFTAARDLRTGAIADLAGVSLDVADDLYTQAWAQHHDAWTRHEQFGAPGVVRFIAGQTPLNLHAQEALLREYETASLTSGVDVVPHAVETLRAIRAAGLSTALICDTGLTPGRVVRELLNERGLGELLQTMAFSDEVGVPKPEGAMFTAALTPIGGGPAIHVGDLRRTDVAGARAAGIASVRFTGIYDDQSDHPDADVVIERLSDLLPLLGLDESASL